MEIKGSPLSKDWCTRQELERGDECRACSESAESAV